MDQVRDTTSKYPVMLPDPVHFATCMTDLGVRPDDILVFYDTLEVGFYSAPRVAWTCRYFGHADVHVLNNFSSYVAGGFDVSSGELPHLPNVQVDRYPIRQPLSLGAVIDYKELRDLLLSKNTAEGFQVLDARPHDRFFGKNKSDPTTLGHMPSAINIPLASILGPDRTLLKANELRQLFVGAGVHGTLPVILTCNSGVTAAALDLALDVSGYGMERRIYDGSWTEWTDRVTEQELIVLD
jgi:thiosulfate/3-mercaptopyruvate sulfurtransferase